MSRWILNGALVPERNMSSAMTGLVVLGQNIV